MREVKSFLVSKEELGKGILKLSSYEGMRCQKAA